MKLHLDYETRSECDLELSGAYVYARHPSTKVLCAAYAFGSGVVRYWAAAAGAPIPPDLNAALHNRRCEVHAWNAQFERLITKHVVGVDVPLERFYCTAALARARGLPGKLETALAYLDEAPALDVKRRGNAVMMKWCKPLAQGGWADDPDEYMELLKYCIGDVTAERMICKRLWFLSSRELEEYRLTEVINDRGLPIDVPLAQAAQGYGAEERRELSSLLGWMTSGRITSVSQHARIKDYLKEKLGLDTFARYFKKGEKESTDRNARADYLNSEDAKEGDTDVTDLIEIIDDAGKASVSKFARMAARAADNGRAEGSYLCWGAAQTKRYSSRGVQVHNLPRKAPADPEKAADLVMRGQVPSPVMHVLASLLRPTIKASPGRRLIWGDWAAVEARAMPWLAACKEKLDLYRNGIDVYRVNAKDIFDVEPDQATEDQRQIGKVAELSLQFGGAKGALKAMARGYGISVANPDNIVQAWRVANKWAMRFSQGLYKAFLATTLGVDTTAGMISYRQIIPLLEGTVSIACDLPGGTTLYYHGIAGHVALEYNDLDKPALIDIGNGNAGWCNEDISIRGTEVTFAKTLPAGFHTERVWHGLLAENVTQALCAALLRDCLQRVEDRAKCYEVMIVGHTHDEIILEADEEQAHMAGVLLRLEMERVPEWLLGLPLGCSVKTAVRYGK